MISFRSTDVQQVDKPVYFVLETEYGSNKIRFSFEDIVKEIKLSEDDGDGSEYIKLSGFSSEGESLFSCGIDEELQMAQLLSDRNNDADVVLTYIVNNEGKVLVSSDNETSEISSVIEYDEECLEFDFESSLRMVKEITGIDLEFNNLHQSKSVRDEFSEYSAFYIVWDDDLSSIVADGKYKLEDIDSITNHDFYKLAKLSSIVVDDIKDKYPELFKDIAISQNNRPKM